MRKKVIAGNWKMNKTNSEATEFLNQIKEGINTDKVDVVVCPTYLSLTDMIELTKDTKISVGAQNMYFEEKGAYTGEISGEMLKEIGVKYCIIGHSERRQYFAETDDNVNKKAKKLIELGITPIICVGESLDQRENNETLVVVTNQVTKALQDISSEDISKMVIAYEPIWAIGTGRTATNDQAEEVCMQIREVVKNIYDESTAQNLRIQYGGSVTKDNAKDLFAMPNIDGALVGGASLKSDFIDIVKA